MGQSNAPWREVVANALAPKRACSTLELCSGPDEFDEDAIRVSVATIENLIQSMVQSGIDSRRIVLIGFSQGAAMSMMVSLTRPDPSTRQSQTELHSSS
ncbi:hypothetical protein L208DRAFT_1400657 [Tricholoma matsutake]|nr:hypothetical protein L208DRAFT_1400657 [Tricholoma matsutake 945]